MSSRTVLKTRRLRLRSWKMADVRRYQEACNTPAVMRWLGGVQSRADLKRDVRYFIRSEVKEGYTYWVVERLRDNAFLGFCGLVRIPDRDCPFRGALEIGWRIRRSAWRKGYAFEAASAVLTYAFALLDAELVVSRTAKGNLPSQGLMRKLGLIRRRRLDYRPRDEHEKLKVYCISSAAWRQRR